MSRIEQVIDEIEDLIDRCKMQPLSTTKISVNKEELSELLVELRLQIPNEVKQYQKIIINQDAILNNAKAKADSILTEANKMTEQLVDEHEIMQKAYATANQMIEDANAQAQDILDAANNDANAIRTSAIQYTDDMLNNLQMILNHTMDGTQNKFNDFMSSMQASYDTVTSNRNELNGSEDIEDNSNEYQE